MTTANDNSISVSGELDNVAYNMLAGHTYQIRVQAAAGSALDPEISQILDPSQNAIAGAANADYGFSRDARVTVTATVAGQYGIGIKGQNGTTGNYIVTVTDFDAPAPTDNLLTMSAGQTYSGSILPNVSTRTIFFDLSAGHEYQFSLQSVASGDALNTPVLRGIYDDTGKPLMGSYGQAAGGGALNLSVTPTASGTYHAVMADGYDDIGAFNFGFREATAAAATNEYVVGDAGLNYIIAHSGNDTIKGGGGNDIIDGATGSDTAIYTGNRTAYSVKYANGALAVTDSNTSRDGADTLNNIEHLQFADVTVDLTVQATAASIARTDLNSIIELYAAYFNRVPDAGGLAYWINQVKAGTTLDQVAQSFYDAGVAFSNVTGYTATMPTADFIRIIYANVLGRGAAAGTAPPPDADVTYWVSQVDSGAYTKGTLMKKMISDVHTYFTNDPTWGWVASLLNNKVAVGYAFAVQDGLGYTDANQAITQGMAIAHAVTSTDITAAIALIGITDEPLLPQ